MRKAFIENCSCNFTALNVSTVTQMRIKNATTQSIFVEFYGLSLLS